MHRGLCLGECELLLYSGYFGLIIRESNKEAVTYATASLLCLIRLCLFLLH